MANQLAFFILKRQGVSLRSALSIPASRLCAAEA